MKKIFFIILFFISLKGFSQYPAKQTLGTDSTEINGKGAIKSRLINFVFTDTTQANNQRIKQYPGAQIFTSSDNKLWLRNFTATAWILQGGGSTLSSFDTTTIYQTINDILIYLGDTSFTNQFMPFGILTDTSYYLPNSADSIRRTEYTDGTVVDDTLTTSIVSSIVNNITTIINAIDSIRTDTTFARGRIRFFHDPNSRNDTIEVLTFIVDTAGLVPPPMTVDLLKFLRTDGTWAVPAGATYTAGNGITDSLGRFILGGTLYKQTTINAIDNNLLLNSYSITSALGIVNNGLNGQGVAVQTSSGTVFSGYSVTGLPMLLTIEPSSTNTTATVLSLQRVSSGTAANGIAGSIDYTLQTDLGNYIKSNTLVSKWTDVTNATRTSQFDITGINSAVTETFANFQTGGIVRVNNLADTLATKAYARSVGGGGGGSGTVTTVTGTSPIVITSTPTTTPNVTIQAMDATQAGYVAAGGSANKILHGDGTWKDTTASSGWSLTGNSGITAVTNFIGTTDSKSFRVRTNNTERMIIDSLGKVGIGTTKPNVLLDTRGSIEIATADTSYQNYFNLVYGGVTPNHVQGIGVYRQLNGDLNRHAFEDYSILNQTGFTNGYASYDAQPIAIGGTQDHFTGLQSRPIWKSSGNVTSYMSGLSVTTPQNLGSGNIANYYGARLNNIANTGGGSITNNYGIYLENVTGATTINRAIYSAGGTSEFAGDININGSGFGFQAFSSGSVGAANTKAVTLYSDATGSNILSVGRGTFSTAVPDINFLAYNGTGSVRQLMLIKSNGNVSIGSGALSAWASGIKVVQLGSDATFYADSLSNATSVFSMTNNGYFDGSNWKYIGASSNEASNYYQGDGGHNFRVAAAGTAGNNITWLTPLKITSAGNVISPTDNTYDLGASGATRFRTGYFGTSLRSPKFETAASVQWTSGTGSPESVVTAAVGSLYTRTDGGANTTLYVKESGSGNTGWIAK